MSVLVGMGLLEGVASTAVSPQAGHPREASRSRAETTEERRAVSPLAPSGLGQDTPDRS